MTSLESRYKAPSMTPEQRNWWRISLELKLRKSSGDAFQDFFSTVMAKAHGTSGRVCRISAFAPSCEIHKKWRSPSVD